ncbi:MAG TPA: transposase [Terriglobales bacterium]|nr:transposase [Terriglobales bacterium]
MPTRLKRYQHLRDAHYITFTCYHRKPHLRSKEAKELFERTLERVRRWYGFYVYGYVVMPEHVHLLLSEPERRDLSVALQLLKQIVSRKIALAEPFWQRRYYDFNVCTERKFIEKLRYMHRNPVRRELVREPKNWLWSSFRHYLTGTEGTVEIESEWTANKRERMGIVPRVKIRSA